jgi:REP element-mobilizing transposase RayT
MNGIPLAYFITFSCYGTWLHGDARGSVDREHNGPHVPALPPDAVREREAQGRLKDAPYELGQRHRVLVLQVIQEVCAHRGWSLLAAHIRPLHVHVVVSGQAAPERMMNDFKAYATRKLRESGVDVVDRPRWTRHGSTRYLWTEERVRAAVHYTLYEQGEPLEAFNGCGLEQCRSQRTEPSPTQRAPAEPASAGRPPAATGLVEPGVAEPRPLGSGGTPSTP